MDLDSIYDSLVNFKGYDINFSINEEASGNEAIVTICTSGEGAAVKLKELIEEVLSGMTNRNISVIPIGMNQMETVLAELSQKHTLLAAVGMIKPKFAIPFISLEKIIAGEGETILRKIVKSNVNIVNTDKNIIVRKLAEESLEKFLTYLNPKKVISVLMEFQSVLEKEMPKKWNNPLRVRLLVHCGCALERMVIHDGLKYQGDRTQVNTLRIEMIQKAASVFEKRLKITLTEDEIYYISEMF